MLHFKIYPLGDSNHAGHSITLTLPKPRMKTHAKIRKTCDLV